MEANSIIHILKMKKLSGNTISVFKGSSEIISSSLSDWSQVKDGAYLRIFGDDVFYTILNCEEYFFIKPFEIVNPVKISFTLDENENPHELLMGDLITISYKEYELDSIFGFKSKGKNYKKGTCYLDGGELAAATMEVKQETQLNITEVNSEGEIQKIGIVNRGKYFTTPSEECLLVSDSGSNAIIECDYREVSNRAKIEREIKYIEIKNGVVYLTLNYALPKGLKTGKLSVSKWKINLKEVYNGPDKLSSEYALTNDFTPNFGFPIMPKGIQRPDVVYNNAMVRIDQILKELKDSVEKLKSS